MTGGQAAQRMEALPPLRGRSGVEIDRGAARHHRRDAAKAPQNRCGYQQQLSGISTLHQPGNISSTAA